MYAIYILIRLLNSTTLFYLLYFYIRRCRYNIYKTVDCGPNLFCSEEKWGLVFNATFNNISVVLDNIFSGQFYWWGKPEFPEKTTDLSQVIHRSIFALRALSK